MAMPLYKQLRINPQPNWINRDRFILFQLVMVQCLYMPSSPFWSKTARMRSRAHRGSKTPGHPEFGYSRN